MLSFWSVCSGLALALTTTACAGDVQSPGGPPEWACGGFGRKGKVRLGQQVSAIAAQHDGTLIAVGNAIDRDDEPLQVTRLSSDGARDAAYAVDGRFVLESAKVRADDVVVDADGRAMFSGSTNYTGPEGVLGRLLPDGSVDPSFGDEGFVGMTGRIALEGDRVAVANDEWITLLTSAGVPVDTFGMGGTVDIAGSGLDARFQGAGRFVVFGKYDSGNWIVRLDASGVFDSSFGDRGYIWTSGKSMALDAKGRVLVTGDNCDTGQCRTYVQRFTPDGHIDTSFGEGGTFTSDRPGASYAEMKVLPDGRILVVGLSYIMRLLPDGRLERDFGEQGYVSGFIEDGGRYAAVVSDGRIYLAAGGDSGVVGAAPWQSALYCIEPDGR